MTRGILIAGNESSFFNTLAAEAGKRVEQCAVVFIPRRLAVSTAAPEESGRGKRAVLQWNPGSPISARTLMVSAENRLGQITEAVLVCSPPSFYRRPEGLSPLEIEAMVNDQIKGWFYLVKELVTAFKRRGGGTLVLVAPESGTGGVDGPADLLGAPAAAAFRAFAQGLLSQARDESVRFLGFTAKEAAVSGAEKEALFASYLFRVMENPAVQNNGKWRRYRGLGFLDRIARKIWPLIPGRGQRP